MDQCNTIMYSSQTIPVYTQEGNQKATKKMSITEISIAKLLKNGNGGIQRCTELSISE